MKKLPKILLIEDNEGDAELVKEALGNRQLKSEILVIDDGEEAINFLNGSGKYKGEAPPNLIVLDVNLPKVDGKEILMFVKNNPNLKKIPVVIFTTSSLQSDIDFAYSNHANCYIVKSGDLSEFKKVISALEDFWVHSVTYANIN